MKPDVKLAARYTIQFGSNDVEVVIRGTRIGSDDYEAMDRVIRKIKKEDAWLIASSLENAGVKQHRRV